MNPARLFQVDREIPPTVSATQYVCSVAAGTWTRALFTVDGRHGYFVYVRRRCTHVLRPCFMAASEPCQSIHLYARQSILCLSLII
jgi:hypothetical protein